MAAGAAVRSIAEQYDIVAEPLSDWRRQACEGELTGSGKFKRPP